MSTLVLCVICWISTVYVTTVSAKCTDSDMFRLVQCAKDFQNSTIAQDLSTIQGDTGGMTGGGMVKVMTKSHDMLCESNSPFIEIFDCLEKYVGRCKDMLGPATPTLKFINFSGMREAIQDLCDNRDDSDMNIPMYFTDPNNTLCLLEKNDYIEQCVQMKIQSRARDDISSKMCRMYDYFGRCFELYADCSSNLVAVAQRAMGKTKPASCPELYVTTDSAECTYNDLGMILNCAKSFQRSTIGQDLTASMEGTGGNMMEVMTKSLDMMCERNENSPFIKMFDCLGKYVGKCMDRLGADATGLKFIHFSGMSAPFQDLCDNKDVFTNPNNAMCISKKKSDIEQCFQMKTQSRVGDDETSRMCGIYNDSALCYELAADCSSKLVAVTQRVMGKMKPAACRGCTMTGLSAIVLLMLSLAAISLHH